MIRQSQTKRTHYILAAALTLLMLVVGGKWYSYVAHADSPFDDVGSGINALMPGPINRLGCELLKRRFGDIPIPPRGCNAGGNWL